MCYVHIYTTPAIFLTTLPKIKSLTEVKGTTTIGLNSPQLRRSSIEDIFQKCKRESEK